MRIAPDALRLYLVTDPNLCAEAGLVETVVAAVRGGVTCVQYRDKDATTAHRVRTARALMDALDGRGVPVIVNDDVAAAIEAGADGVHVGQGDGDPARIRDRIGPDRILGLSCETRAAVAAAEDGIVDYLGIGPVYATGTKPGHAAPIGWGGLRELDGAARMPDVAIGGLKAEHTGRAEAAGARGIAVVSAICGQPDPEDAARAFRKAGP